MSFPNRKQIWISCTILTIAVILILAGIFFLLIFPSILQYGIRKNAYLKEGGDMLRKWKNPSYDMKTEFYTFSVTNPNEIEKGQKPSLTKKGPYTFRQKQHRRNVEFIDQDTLTYDNHKFYRFDSSSSCDDCKLTDKLWIPNIVYQKFVEAASTPKIKVAAGALLAQTPFLEVNVSDLLFNGYKDPFLQKVCQIPFMKFVCKRILHLPERIGFFYQRNGTSEGRLEIESGAADIEQIGHVLRWKDLTILPKTWWLSTEARMINGSAELFPPFLTKGHRQYLFTPAMCRSIYLEYEKEVRVNGIGGYRFVVPSSVFNWSLPENEGFCHPSDKRFYSPETQPTACLPSGLLDISRCQQGDPPVVFSLSNFLYSPDAVWVANVGMEKPNPDIDGIHIDVEPTSGTVLRASSLTQVNVALWKGKDITFPVDLSSFHSGIVPVILMNDSAVIDVATKSILQGRLLDLEAGAALAGHLLLLVGIAVLLVCMAICAVLYSAGRSKVGESDSRPKTSIEDHTIPSYSAASTMRPS